MNKPLDLKVWKAACELANTAILINHAYDDKSIWFVEATQQFVVVSTAAGCAEIAHAILAQKIIDDCKRKAIALKEVNWS